MRGELTEYGPRNQPFRLGCDEWQDTLRYHDGEPVMPPTKGGVWFFTREIDARRFAKRKGIEIVEVRR